MCVRAHGMKHIRAHRDRTCWYMRTEHTCQNTCGDGSHTRAHTGTEHTLEHTQGPNINMLEHMQEQSTTGTGKELSEAVYKASRVPPTHSCLPTSRPNVIWKNYPAQRHSARPPPWLLLSLPTTQPILYPLPGYVYGWSRYQLSGPWTLVGVPAVRELILSQDLASDILHHSAAAHPHPPRPGSEALPLL